MTSRTRKHWPAIAERRRFVIASRTPGGEPCTLIVERDDSGLIVSFPPDPVEATELIEALRTAVGAPS